jgi:hypothetical protein
MVNGIVASVTQLTGSGLYGSVRPRHPFGIPRADAGPAAPDPLIRPAEPSSL